MNEPQSPSLQGWNPGFGQDTFPGIGDTFAGPPAVINPTVLPAQAASNVTKSTLPFNLSNLGDLKAMVDRMGGIDGVLSTVGKFQKFMSTMQQIAPMLKLFMGKGGKASTANTTTKRIAPRRRKNNRPTSSKTRPTKRR